MNGLLDQHIIELKAEGYAIDVVPDGSGDQSRYFVVFKDYAIPPYNWGRTNVDLLLIIPGVYPNAKIDMFWVSPKITLPNGGVPEGAGSDEAYLGRTWQRFSWHASKWNPGRDSVKTYLEVVNNRLHTGR